MTAVQNVELSAGEVIRGHPFVTEFMNMDNAKRNTPDGLQCLALPNLQSTRPVLYAKRFHTGAVSIKHTMIVRDAIATAVFMLPRSIFHG